LDGKVMLESLIRIINARHGRAFEARGRYPAGEQGAFGITENVNGDSQDFVLKWNPGTNPAAALRTAALTERLRAVGYPAPRYDLVEAATELGVVYSIQEAQPGLPLGDRLNAQILDHVLSLNALQRGLADTASDDWPRAVVDPVLHGGDGFCLLDPIRSYSRNTAVLLGVLQKLVAAHGLEPRTNDDIVHFDFQGANILVNGDAISGVVDWEGWCVGEATFDLATLYFYTDPRGETEQTHYNRLWGVLVSTTGPQLLGAYLAHLMLRQIDWSIRFHDRSTVERWLNRCDDILGRLADATDVDASE
jgi:aminoglycoside phosphotransferase (APT) family kinase protein